MQEVKITYVPTIKQNCFHGSKAFETLFVGGRGSAKTWGGVMECYTLSIEHAGNIGLMVRKQLTNLVSTTLMSWKKLIPAECYRINEQKHIITIFTGKVDAQGKPINSIIHYAGLDDQESIKKYRGCEFGFILYDQAEECELSDIEEMIPCMRHKLPDGKLPHYRVMYLANPQRSYILNKFTQKMTPHMELIQVSTYDNPHVVDGYIDMLKELYKDRPEQYKAMVLGDLEIADSPKSVISYKSLMAIYAPGQDHIKCHGEKIGVSCDPAGYSSIADATVICVWHGTKVIEYLKLQGENAMSSPAIAAKCLELCKKHGGTWIALDTTGSSIGQGIFDMLKDLTIDTPYIQIIAIGSSNSAINDALYCNARAEMYFITAKYISENKATLPNDEFLKAELLTHEFDYHLGKIIIIDKKLIKKILGRSPDFADAIAIGIYAIDKFVKNVPLNQRFPITEERFSARNDPDNRTVEQKIEDNDTTLSELENIR